jgi:hypothetical protein
MRTRTVVAIVSLLLPAVSSAQHIPLIGRGRGPARPAPLPPQPVPIANELAYRRLPLSVESYPLISFIQSPGMTNDGLMSSWTTFGVGTRADYRVTRLVSATLDLTTSFLGGPALVQTAELGTRLRPERTERRVYPFVDLRAGYVAAYNRYLGTIGDVFGSYPGAQDSHGARYSSGFGGVAGAGMEYALSRSFSLTTAATATRNRLTTRELRGGTNRLDRFTMTSFRYTLGIRYNPVRVIRPAATELH